MSLTCCRFSIAHRLQTKQRRGHLKCLVISRQFSNSSQNIFGVQTRVWGKDRVAWAESITVGSVASLQPGQAALTLFTNPAGGIVDDLIITNAGDHLVLIITD